MPTRRSTEPPRGRYSLDDCVIEIARLRDRLELQDKEIAFAAGVSASQFSHKMANAGKSSFSVDELGRICDFFAAKTGRWLPGWPFVSERECALIERSLGPAANRGKGDR